VVVLITGASSGIGRALAEHYVQQGAVVAAVGRRLCPTASPYDSGGGLFAFQGDVADRDAMAGIVATVEQTLGPVELAIACAGIAEEQSAADLDLDAVERAIATNVRGVFNVLVPIAAMMRLRGRGQVVAISSLAAEHSLPRMTAYCMSKAALNSGMQGLDLLLRGTGVSATTICPGFIATQMTAGRVSAGRCMSLDKAVRKCLHVIRQRRRICHFPVWQYLLLRLLCIMPCALRGRVLLSLIASCTPSKDDRMTRHHVVHMPNRFWTNLRYQLTFNSFIRPTNIVRLWRHLPQISLRYWPRALLIAATSLLAQPLRLLEIIRYGRRIAGTSIDQPPIFIIGHWRSGTTHLHNLFAQDPSLGWLTMYQAIAPDCSLIGGRRLKRLLECVLPERRPMDNMVWPIDSPQEEEVALGKTTAYSFYSQFMFPRKARSFFTSHVLLRDVSDGIAAEVKARYLRILKVAAIHAKGRRLVLKNPVNTARIRMLLELFPDAKFVHIHRSPYEVYASTRNLHRRITAFTTLQSLNDSAGSDTVYALYEEMMRQFLSDRTLIPLGNLAEVRFDDLERDPLGEMSRLYRELSLPSFAQAEPLLRRYVASQTSYRKNGFTLSEAEREQVARKWTFAFTELGYRDQLPADGILS